MFNNKKQCIITREKCKATPVVGVNAVFPERPAVYYQIAKQNCKSLRQSNI